MVRFGQPPRIQKYVFIRSTAVDLNLCEADFFAKYVIFISNEVVGFPPPSSKVGLCSDVFEFWVFLELARNMKTVQVKFLDEHLVVSREFLEKEYKIEYNGHW